MWKFKNRKKRSLFADGEYFHQFQVKQRRQARPEWPERMLYPFLRSQLDHASQPWNEHGPAKSCCVGRKMNQPSSFDMANVVDVRLLFVVQPNMYQDSQHYSNTKTTSLSDD